MKAGLYQVCLLLEKENTLASIKKATVNVLLGEHKCN